ncbi:MAG: hypothetical protein HY897_11475, partial [Deltaproteobacteria bacterium]|nr:hypothetical protein [Deltaproteobacteria bacterium]
MSTVTSAARAAPPLEGCAMKRVLTHRRVAVLVLAMVSCHGLAAPEDALAAPPSFVAAGTIASAAGGAITPGMPAGVLANDVLLLVLETADEAVTVSGGTETWAQVTNSPQSVAGATRLTVFWARASQDAPTSPTTAGPANHVIGRMIAVRGVITSGNPWDVTSGGTEAVSDTTGSITGAATTVIDTLVVAAMATDLPDGNGTANFSGWANASLASVA